MHVIEMVGNNVDVVQLSCDVKHGNVAALFLMDGSALNYIRRHLEAKL